MVEFAQNMGAPLRHLLDGDHEALKSLAYWGGLTVSDIETLQTWSGEPVGDVRMRFRGEVFVSRTLRNPSLRGCPICLRDDAQAQPGDAAEAMVFRGDWQLRDVTLCLRHNHLLVPLWEAQNRYERYDFASRFRQIEARVHAGALDLLLCVPTEHDCWLDRRLETGDDPTWLRTQELYPSAVFCRLLGAELLRIRGAFDGDDVSRLRAAQDAGFAVARQGEAAIAEALMSLVDALGGKREERQAVFGNLYRKLRADHAEDPAFETFRRLVRDCILAVWPVAAGEVVLGQVQPKRRLHSLYSAALELGVTEELLEPYLIEAGALSSDDRRFSNRRVFEADAFADLLAEIPTLVSLRTLKREIGLSRTELERLVAEGLLMPRLQNQKVRLRWSLMDARALLSDLQARAVPVSGSDPGWEALLTASNRRRLSLARLMDEVRQGAISIGTTGGGFSALRVLRSEVDGLMAEGTLERKVFVSPTAFGVSIGIKDKGRFRALVLAGHTPGTWMRHPETGREILAMTPDDIAAFHRRFVTVPTLAAETGRSIPEIRADLKRAGVEVFAPQGQDFGRLFLRDAAKAALSRKR